MGKLGISVKDAHQDANSTMSWLVNNVFFPGGMMNALTGGKSKNWKKGDQGGVARDDFPSPSVVARQRAFIGRGGLLDMRNHSFHNEKTLHADKGGEAIRSDLGRLKQLYNYVGDGVSTILDDGDKKSIKDWAMKNVIKPRLGDYFADEGGLAAATGTPNERGYWLEDEDREREYTTGPIQAATHGGRVARMEVRRSRHEPVLLLPNEVVLTEKQAAAARKAGAKLPTHSLQKRAGKLNN